MYYILITFVYLFYIASVVLYYKSSKQENKILWQTSSHTLFWIILLIASLTLKALYPNHDIQAIGIGLVTVCGIPLIFTTFFVGVWGLIANFKKLKSPLGLFSILGVLFPIFPVALLIFPIVPVLIIIRKIIQSTKKIKKH